MAAGGETFALLVSLAAVWALIKFLDWLLGGVGEAFGLDETPWGDICEVPEEMKLAAAKSETPGGRGRQKRQRASIQTQENASTVQRPLGGSI